jgi:hypothetical protein
VKVDLYKILLLIELRPISFLPALCGRIARVFEIGEMRVPQASALPTPVVRWSVAGSRELGEGGHADQCAFRTTSAVDGAGLVEAPVRRLDGTERHSGKIGNKRIRGGPTRQDDRSPLQVNLDDRERSWHYYAALLVSRCLSLLQEGKAQSSQCHPNSQRKGVDEKQNNERTEEA